MSIQEEQAREIEQLHAQLAESQALIQSNELSAANVVSMYAERVKELQAQRDAALEELERNSKLGVCTWCGEVTSREEIAAHIVDCVKHPMGELARKWEATKDELTEARAHLARAQAVSDEWETSYLHLQEAHNDRDTFAQRLGDWADKTFPQSTASSVVAHMKKEFRELTDAHEFDNGNIAEECADVFMMLTHLANKLGFDLLAEAERKFEIVQKREWGQPDADGVVEHVRAAPVIDHAKEHELDSWEPGSVERETVAAFASAQDAPGGKAE